MLHISSGNVQLLSLQIVDTLSLQILLNSHWLFHVSVFGYVFILDRDCRECIPLGVELDAVRCVIGKDESEREGGGPVAVAQDRGSGTAQLWRLLSLDLCLLSKNICTANQIRMGPVFCGVDLRETGR